MLDDQPVQAHDKVRYFPNSAVLHLPRAGINNLMAGRHNKVHEQASVDMAEESIGRSVDSGSSSDPGMASTEGAALRCQW